MSGQQENYKRWYDVDPVVSRCFAMLEKLDENKKRRTATFLMDEIISTASYQKMLPEDVIELLSQEQRKRRWYDFDEVSRIFVELLRYANEEARKEISIKAVKFIEDL